MANPNNTYTVPSGRFTAHGTMPPDMLLRHKLVGTSARAGVQRYVAARTAASYVRKMNRLVSTYRVVYHGVTERHLASCLRNGVQYFAIPMSRGDSDNPRDRKGLETVEQTSVVKAATEVLV